MLSNWISGQNKFDLTCLYRKIKVLTIYLLCSSRTVYDVCVYVYVGVWYVQCSAV